MRGYIAPIISEWVSLLPVYQPLWCIPREGQHIKVSLISDTQKYVSFPFYKGYLNKIVLQKHILADLVPFAYLGCNQPRVYKIEICYNYYGRSPSKGQPPPKAVNGQCWSVCISSILFILRFEPGSFRVICLMLLFILHILGQLEATFWRLGL